MSDIVQQLQIIGQDARLSPGDKMILFAAAQELDTLQKALLASQIALCEKQQQNFAQAEQLSELHRRQSPMIGMSIDTGMRPVTFHGSIYDTSIKVP